MLIKWDPNLSCDDDKLQTLPSHNPERKQKSEVKRRNLATKGEKDMQLKRKASICLQENKSTKHFPSVSVALVAI